MSEADLDKAAEIATSAPYWNPRPVDKAAIRDGMTTMIDDGLAKIRAGMTSAAEVLRVTTVR